MCFGGSRSRGSPKRANNGHTRSRIISLSSLPADGDEHERISRVWLDRSADCTQPTLDQAFYLERAAGSRAGGYIFAEPAGKRVPVIRGSHYCFSASAASCSLDCRLALTRAARNDSVSGGAATDPLSMLRNEAFFP